VQAPPPLPAFREKCERIKRKREERKKKKETRQIKIKV
jgi:hypothetical protein